jgi:hypothetical protein
VEVIIINLNKPSIFIPSIPSILGLTPETPHLGSDATFDPVLQLDGSR